MTITHRESHRQNKRAPAANQARRQATDGRPADSKDCPRYQSTSILVTGWWQWRMVTDHFRLWD